MCITALVDICNANFIKNCKNFDLSEKDKANYLDKIYNDVNFALNSLKSKILSFFKWNWWKKLYDT